jgi:hypothetical protein
LLREFAQAPEMATSLRNEKVQKNIRDFGFKSIELVQPVAGKLDKKTGLRTIIYPYIEGTNLRSYISDLIRSKKLSAEQIINLNQNITDLESMVRNYLFEAGWVVYDISDRNLMCSPDNRLFLVDVEFSRKRTNNESFGDVFLRK